MNEQEIKHWYAQRMQYAANLVDYLMLIGQNNRVLQSNPKLIGSSLQPAFGPNPNRVGIVVGCVYPNTANALTGRIQIMDDVGATVLWGSTIIAKEADIAGVSLSPVIYQPLELTVLNFGPLIQRRIDVIMTFQAGLTIYVEEITMNPKCCDYIGVIQHGSMNIPPVESNKFTGSTGAR